MKKLISIIFLVQGVSFAGVHVQQGDSLTLPDGTVITSTAPFGEGDGLPSQTGNAGKLITTNGTVGSWETQTAGAGIGILQTTGEKTWSVDSGVVPYLALDNAFLGDNAFAGALTSVPSSTATAVAGTPISVTSLATVLLNATGDTTMTAAPTIANGVDGQKVTIINIDSADDIVFQDEASLASSNLCLDSDTNQTIAPLQTLQLQYVDFAGCWVQIGGNGSASPGSSVFVKEYPAAVCQSAAGSLAMSATSTLAPIPDCAIGANTYYGVAKFIDTSTGAVQGHFSLPSSVASASVDIDWRTAATSGNARWYVKTACAADDEADDPAWNAAQGVTTTAHGTANDLTRSTIASLTLTGCAAGERFFFEVRREPYDAADTLASTAEMIAVKFTVQ